MQKLSSNQIRNLWIKFFQEKDHHFLAPASLIPVDDHSLLWINSGVATLKPYFDGRKTPPSPRLVNSQKSIRTNDIENVGYTARHHTLFEMLGNFSIGDYFKKEALVYAWEFMTSKKWLGLEEDKLYITVYEEDDETYQLWKDVIKVPEDRIIKGSRETNFWDIGEGPCGPNTEIYYDRGVKYDPENVGLKLLIEDIENDRYLEVWNIVFSQYNHNSDNTYSDLPRKNIDTGAGLERLASIIQDTPTNFETDLFMPIIKNIEQLTNNKYHYDADTIFNGSAEQNKINTSFKVIADHIRATTFAIADGVFPSNKERGYVIRRLIRRACLYGHKLGIKEPFLYKLVDSVVEIMVDFYSYLEEKKPIVKLTIKNEEEKFLKTLEQGQKLFNEIIENKKYISANDAFLLFESYGFPIEMIQEEAKELGIKVDVEGYDKLLNDAKELSRNTRKNVKAMQLQSKVLVDLKVKSEFVGYEVEECQTKVNFIIKNNENANYLENEEGIIILEKTPFYAEKGGQAADKGIIISDNVQIEVIDVQQGPSKQHLHHVIVNGRVNLNDDVKAIINKDKRFYTMKNHSGTHIVHSALREILGYHVMQIGSANDEEKLKIDISHFKPISYEEQQAVENLVIEKINEDIKCEIIYTDYETAINKYHALAFFTEKYDEIVRIVKFGEFSCELCGGTHVSSTKDIEDFMITHIESKGANTYRVHAITSNQTITKYLNEEFNKIKNTASEIYDKYLKQKDILSSNDLERVYNSIANITVTKVNLVKIKQQLDQLQLHYKNWSKEVENILNQKLISKYNNLEVRQNNDKNIIAHQINEDISVNVLKSLVDLYREKHQKAIVLLISNQRYVIGVSEELTSSYPAREIASKINSIWEGNGGGNAKLAQGGIKNSDKISEVITKFGEMLN